MIEALKKAREALMHHTEQTRPITRTDEAIAAIDAALAQAEAPADDWQKLYRRAVNEANGLTNYIEYRPELRDAERRLAKIEADARDLQARAASAPAAPGWQFVPVEPTADMRNAFHAVTQDDVERKGNAGAHWLAMLAAAPKDPT